MGYHSLLQQDLSDPGIKPGSSALQAGSLPTEPPSHKLESSYTTEALPPTGVKVLSSTSGSQPGRLAKGGRFSRVLALKA